jgi:hypothetical protein
MYMVYAKTTTISKKSILAGHVNGAVEMQLKRVDQDQNCMANDNDKVKS